MLSFKNIMKGMGTIMDIYPVNGKYIIPAYRPMRSDSEILEKDWKKVGDTLFMIMNKGDHNTYQASSSL